jgi:hypothetical protein
MFTIVILLIRVKCTTVIIGLICLMIIEFIYRKLRIEGFWVQYLRKSKLKFLIFFFFFSN